VSTSGGSHACSAVDDAHRGSVHDDRRHHSCREQPHSVGFALTLQTRGFARLQQCHGHLLDRDVGLQPPKRGTLLAVVILTRLIHRQPQLSAVLYQAHVMRWSSSVTQIEGTARTANFFIPLVFQLETIIRLRAVDSHKIYTCLI
jgi:hypothetical protein